MKAKEKTVPAFLSGGGEMGELIRFFDWSKTTVGNPDTWPQSLRIAVRIMLDTPFGMYIAWGKEYIQMYNDGYRPILGATKHPQALGISTRQTFAEIWPTIGPMFDGVMQGIPVGFPDFVLQLDRNGFAEECVFDFSYSPIRLEDGEVGGVLVTVIETTEKVKAAKALKENEQELQFAINATELGTWDLNPVTNKFRGNSRLKEWFGLKPNEEIELPLALAVIADKDRDKVTAAIQTALQFNSGGHYDIIYTIIHPQTKNERIVRAKGQAFFNDEGIAYRFNGTLQDVTKEIVARQLLTESEAKFRTLSENIPHMIWTATPDGKKNFFNRYFLNYTGLSFEDLKGDGWQAIIFPDDLEKELQQWNQQLKTGEEFKIEKRILHHDGTYRWHISRGIAQKDIHGNIMGWIGSNTEIEDQKKITEVLAKGEEQFRTFANNIQNLAWIASGDGWIYWYNQRWYDYTGTSIEEMEGWGWQKVHHPDHVEKITALVKELWKKGEPFELTFPLRRYDGEYRWFLTGAYPVKDAGGNIERWIGTNTDITEQKDFTEELEAKVKERTYQLHIQNETFKQAEESSMQGSFSYNLTTGKFSCSDNLYRLLGYSPNEFERRPREFKRRVHPDDRDYIIQSAQKVLQGKMADEWHYRMNTKSGEVINIKGTGRVIESRGEKLLVGTLQDVTKEFELNRELQEKEEYLKQIINNAPDAVIVINEKSIITLWNPKTEEIFGWKAEEVLGQDLTNTIIPAQYRENHKEGMKRFLTTGEARILNKTLELTALNKAGKEFTISLTISHSTQQGNKLFIAFLRDITLEKQNQEDLIVKKQQLEQMNQLLELKHRELENRNAELASFSYVASHDLQEPLRKIQTFGRRILETEIFSDKTQDYLNRMITAGERMQNLVISLLEFSRTNTTELIFEPCDLNMILEESKNDLQVRILEKQAWIEHENLPVINGIPIQLSQLFSNLIDNAIKYSRPQIKPHIKIISSVIEGKLIEHSSANKEMKYHAIQFTDNGIGFEQEYADKIFELFQRLHGRNEYSGTGIGLGIVKKIVTNHHGFIVAKGNPNIGSTFTIYIPTG